MLYNRPWHHGIYQRSAAFILHIVIQHTSRSWARKPWTTGWLRTPILLTGGCTACSRSVAAPTNAASNPLWPRGRRTWICPRRGVKGRSNSATLRGSGRNPGEWWNCHGESGDVHSNRHLTSDWCKGFCRCYPKLPQVAQCFLVVLLINLRAMTMHWWREKGFGATAALKTKTGHQSIANNLMFSLWM